MSRSQANSFGRSVSLALRGCWWTIKSADSEINLGRLALLIQENSGLSESWGLAGQESVQVDIMDMA